METKEVRKKYGKIKVQIVEYSGHNECYLPDEDGEG